MRGDGKLQGAGKNTAVKFILETLGINSTDQAEIVTRKRSDSINRPKFGHYPKYQPAFDFLGKLGEAKHDLTSSGPLRPNRKSKFPPPVPSDSVIAALRNEGEGGQNWDNLMEGKGTSRGDPKTLASVVSFLRRKGIECNIDNVSLTDGIFSAIDTVLTAMNLTGDDTVMVIAPTFGYHAYQATNQGAKCEIFDTEAETGFLPDLIKLRNDVRKFVPKALIMCYPNNPTGAVMTKDCAKEIVNIARDNGVTIISDEAFLNNPLTANKHHSIASIEGFAKVGIAITSTKKSTLTGEQQGFCAGQRSLVNNFNKVGGYNKRSQAILTAVLEDNEGNERYSKECVQYYSDNINLVREELNNLNNYLVAEYGPKDEKYVRPLVDNPDASNVYLLTFPGLKGVVYKSKDSSGEEVTRTINSGLDVAKFLLEKTGIGVVPGECSFLKPESMAVRITLNHERGYLKEIFEDMIKGIKLTPLEVPDAVRSVVESEASEEVICPPQHIPPLDVLEGSSKVVR